MRKPRFQRAAALLPAAALLASGCITLTEAQLEARDYRRADFTNRYVDYRKRCLAAGGRIIIDAKQPLGRNDIPHRGDRYYCH